MGNPVWVAKREEKCAARMAEHRDFKSYYRVLGVPAGASGEELKRAYRKLAKDLHPDRHSDDPTATAKFQSLNEAYAVLSNPSTRARYDAACMVAETASSPRQAIDPLPCSSCGAVSAQPRYIIFWYVISLIFVTSRRTMQGVFCPSCAAKTAVRASTISWLLGWWGFPWGPIWTIGALYRNMLNSTQPADVNGQILGHQALYFWNKGNPNLAAATIDQALGFKVAPTLRERLLGLKDTLPPLPKARLIDRWKLVRGWGFWVQLAPALAVVVFVTWVNWGDIEVATAKHKDVEAAAARRALAHAADMKTSVFAEPDSAARVLATVRPFEDFNVLVGRGTERYERVITGRGVVGYISKGSILDGGGTADLTHKCFPFGPVQLTNGMIFRQTSHGPHVLKTTNGLSSDAVVKLRDMTGHTVLSFYVKSGSQASINNVSEGQFTIEFGTGYDFSKDCGYFLRDNTYSRFVDSAIFETKTEGDYRYNSVIEITLNPVVGGTAKTESLDDITFDQD
jgi:DnaJ domain